MTRTKPQSHEEEQRQCGPRIDDAVQEQPGVPQPLLCGFVALCEIISRRGAEARSVCAAARALGQWRQRIPRSLHEKLKIAAAREGVSLNAYVANVLAERMGMVG